MLIAYNQVELNWRTLFLRTKETTVASESYRTRNKQ